MSGRTAQTDSEEADSEEADFAEADFAPAGFRVSAPHLTGAVGTALGAGGAAVLDNPIWGSLTSAHAHLAIRRGRAARYPSGLSLFAAVEDDADPAAWADLAALCEPGEIVYLAGLRGTPPPGWDTLSTLEGVQMVGLCMAGQTDPEAVPLGPRDVPEILALVHRTRPGPFLQRTIELGSYLGIRHGGALVAMAGERMRPPGWTEISAVCTDEGHRGKGLARRLVHSVVAGIQERGETPFLHVGATNTPAIRLYQKLGFTIRRRIAFVQVRVPRLRGS